MEEYEIKDKILDFLYEQDDNSAYNRIDITKMLNIVEKSLVFDKSWEIDKLLVQMCEDDYVEKGNGQMYYITDDGRDFKRNGGSYKKLFKKAKRIKVWNKWKKRWKIVTAIFIFLLGIIFNWDNVVSFFQCILP